MVNRQLEMVYILMNKGSVTAEELAERFEVSTRTVYRDIDSLSMAGIPVYANRGKGGGIRLMEHFVLDRRLLSKEEQGRILAALASLRETGASQDIRILEKLETFFKAESLDWVAIDFSDWSGRRGELYGQIKEAILGRHVMAFDYYGQYGDMMRREVEPIQLLFKEYTWYVRAYCRIRGAMRLFKVLRMKRVEVLEESFELGPRHRVEEEHSMEEGHSMEERHSMEKSLENPALGKRGEPGRDKEAGKEGKAIETGQSEEAPVCRGEPESPMEAGKAEGMGQASGLGKEKGSQATGGRGEPEAPMEAGKPGVQGEIVFRIDRKEAYRVYDRFEEDEITVLPQGDFEIRMRCLVDDWVYGLILSFGPSARVLGPDWVREELTARIRRMGESYGMALLRDADEGM
ncbi:WYL domain-containing protein [uncultured Acetatifactor sp.]|uniref:HTH domain-containing protein n=1 Tax=uncultured Acetatifactor sp. TaxID=1671927 RepID=UPI0026049978|nr:WYL domain-containing protein [uncultured Acetatifactor sp.]